MARRQRLRAEAIGLRPKCFRERAEDDDGDQWIRDLLIEPVLEEFPFYGHRKVTKELFRQMMPEELNKVREYVGDAQYNAGKYEEAARLFDKITNSEEFVEFLTLPAYEAIP